MPDVVVERHKSALHRADLSKPIRLAIADDLVGEGTRVFDYGCGRGEDVRQLKRRGIDCDGWDPTYRPDTKKTKADVVNLGYVVNVIEDPRERVEALQTAWQLARRVLVVSGRLTNEIRGERLSPYRDGFLTKIGTFQKFFEQNELRGWLDSTLDTTSVPAAPGVFYVFREDTDRETYLANRFRRRVLLPRISRSEQLFEEYKDLLQELMQFLSDRGRLPNDDEFARTDDLKAAFGSFRRAFSVIRRVTGEEQWDEILQTRALDLLVYAALSRFGGRPKFTRLPRPLQLDVKAFFSNYKEACEAADDLLFAVGEQGVISDACQTSLVGKITHDALYVHKSALGSLGPLLRIYEGCARAYLGEVEGTNIVKLGRLAPKISYLAYPDFDADPHPALHFSLSVNMQTFSIKERHYDIYANPPILHRKEEFVAETYRFRKRFSRLTLEEEKAGLLAVKNIGLSENWKNLLQQRGLTIHRHRLIPR